MKKAGIIISFFILINLYSKAQSGWFVRPNLSYNKFEILNAETKERFSIEAKNSFNSKFGLDIGFQITDERSGLYALSVGVYSQPLEMVFDSRIKYPERLNYLETKLNLNYLNFPVKFEFAVLKQKKFCPIAILGFEFNYLLNYKEHSVKYKGDKRIADEIIVENNSQKKPKNGLYGITSEMDQWYYNRFLFGIIGGIGVKYSFSKRWNAIAIFHGSIGLNDTENKAQITHTYTVPGYEEKFVSVFSPYEKYYDRITEGRELTNIEPRGISRNFNIGVQVGVSYLFIKGFRVSLN